MRAWAIAGAGAIATICFSLFASSCATFADVTDGTPSAAGAGARPSSAASSPGGATPARFSADDEPLLAHPQPVVDYTLSAKLDSFAHTVAGVGTLRWTNTSAVPVDELWFHLYLNAFKNQRSVYLREPLGAGRGGAVVKDWGTIDVRRLFWREANAELWPGAELHRPGDEDETDVRVPLPRAVEPGQTITLEMTWDDKLPNVIERTGYAGSFHFVGQWFPKIARLESDGTWAHFPFHRLSEFYADFGRYDVTLDVPESFVVGATGPSIESTARDGRRIERHVQDDIHDFAWTAWDGYRSREETVDGVAVRMLFPAGYESVAERELATMRFALPHFRTRYGAYPYSLLTVVHPPETAGEAGGMEYPTLITTGGPWWTPPQVRSIESVTIHEFGHQYFYGLLASNENAWPFLDEGLNTFAEHESMTSWLGQGSMWDGGGLKLDGLAIDATFSNDSGLIQPVGQRAPAFQSFELYGRLVYLRTGAILATLRRVYGAEKFDAALGGYTRRYRFRHPTPDDFFATMTAELGAEAGENLRKAVMEKGWVDYQVLSTSSHSTRAAAGIFDREGKRETLATPPLDPKNGFSGWVLLAREGTLIFPVDVDVLFENGKKQRLRWDGRGDTIRLPVSGSSMIRSVFVDPDRLVLLDRNPRDNVLLAPGANPYATSSALERVVNVASAAVEALFP